MSSFSCCAQQPGAPGIASQQSVPSSIGSISGTVADEDGTLVSGARINLTSGSSSNEQLAVTDDQGRFTFAAVAAGNFSLTVSAEGRATGVASGTLHAGEVDELPEISLRVATTTDVEVNLSQHDLAEGEIKLEEGQRIFGVAPNFFVSYDWHAAPLTTRQKFELANKSMLDPMTVVMSAGEAGLQQWQNDYAGYGQGASGYFKRFGASYADSAIGIYLGGAILPALFHEDPRYFYKGTGSGLSRTLYALSSAVVARNDHGKRQPSYAGILGDMGAGAISNIYYPAGSRNGASLTIENGLLSIASDAIGNVIQEFILRRFSIGVPKSPKP